MKELILILLLFVLAISSCEKYLEEEPKSLVSDATFYRTYDQAVVGVATAYAEMRANGEVLYRIWMPSDVCVDGSFFDWLWTPTSHPNVPYSEYYKVISEANVALERTQENAEEINASLPTSSASSEIKSSGIDAAMMIQGEARFLRALMYFKLVSYYGDVPLILNSFARGDIPTDLVRAPKNDVYEQIRTDLKFAMEHCGTKTMVPSGRVTKAAAAGMLAKVDLYWAAITLRDEKYWDRNLLPEQPENKAALRTELYSEAKDLCTRIINGEFGAYILEHYFPAAATGSDYSDEHLFVAHAKKGEHTHVLYHEGWHGDRGRDLSNYAPFLWDFPTWETRWNSPKKIYELGMALNDTLVAHEWSLTGDTTRRLWSCLIWRGAPDPPQPVSWIIYEPLGRNCGPEFFIEPGLGASPYSNYSEIHRVALNENNGDWTDRIWTIAGRKLSDPEIWRLNSQPDGYSSGKYRLKWPYPNDFEEGEYEHTYPILRLAEIYLLRAEASFFQSDKVLTTEVIADIDMIRERAQNQAPLKELMLNWKDAKGVIKSDHPRLFRDILPAGISGDEGLKILLDERVRELVDENNTRWFDQARFPEVLLPNMHEMSLLEQPLRAGIAVSDSYFTINYNMKDRFSVESNLYMLYMPIPASEIEFYPGLKQTYGY